MQEKLLVFPEQAGAVCPVASQPLAGNEEPLPFPEYSLFLKNIFILYSQNISP